MGYFLEHKVKQVKFIDRTFNCNHDHAMAVWKFLKEHDNQITNFHFEISADLLNKEEIQLLQTFRPGYVQLEIGVQSTNPNTIKAINRTMNLEKLTSAVKQIQDSGNIHQHLDLIAGLPYEDYESFQKSFHEVYQTKPSQLQLGFLKVLKGSQMYQDCEKYHICYKSSPPYEVLYTKWLTYDQMLTLKQIEEMVEIYYNSGQFEMTIRYLEHFFESYFMLYQKLGAYYEKQGLNKVSHSRLQRYEILLSFVEETLPEIAETLPEFLTYDLYLRENLKNRPSYMRDYSTVKKQCDAFYHQENLLDYVPGYESYSLKQIQRMTHLEYFSMDIPKAAAEGIRNEAKNMTLFDYQTRNPLNHQAKTTMIYQ